MVRARLLFVVGASAFVGGCALVSGLSDLDVGETPALIDSGSDARDGSVGLDAAAEAKADVALFDAAPPPSDAGDGAVACGPPPGDGPAINTTCIVGTPIFATGALDAGAYDLVQVRVFQNSCNGFVPSSVTGRLVVTVQGSGYRLDERITTGGVPVTRSYTGVVNGNAMDVKLVCGPSIGTTSWGLNVTTGGGNKNMITFYKDDIKTRYFWN